MHIYKFGQIQTSKTGGQPYSYTAPCKVSARSLVIYNATVTKWMDYLFNIWPFKATEMFAIAI